MMNPPRTNPRLSYIDNIRSLVILLVVAMHGSVCYSGIGGWYYKEGLMENLGPLELTVFAFLQSYSQAWGLGILFFISGCFAAGTLAKKGRAAFVRERLFRLGVPLAAYMLVIAPFIYFVLMRDIPHNGPVMTGGPAAKGLAVSWIRYLLGFQWLGETGPLWFNEALLIFCLVFALIRRRYSAWADSAAPQKPSGSPKLSAMPGRAAVLLIILGTGIAAFLIRLVFPIGTDVLNLQFSFFASYIVLFALGIKAGENNWLSRISGGPQPGPENTRDAGAGRFWFIAALAVGIPLWFIIMICGGALEGTVLIYGGPHWQSAAYALWESFTAVSFSLGLLWFFYRTANGENPLSRFIAANAFGVYMFHPPVLVGISILLRFWEAAPAVKFLAVTPLAIGGSLAVSALLRLLPPVRAILK
jgi:surface polysaccharide O-acyltransferase-like enzyme